MKARLRLLLILLSLSLVFGQQAKTLEDIPDKIEIGILENIFEPVHFDHKLHADMTHMGDGCKTCHHNDDDGVYRPCAECHVSEEENASMAMPTINAAYHRNCLNCHQNWTGDEVCKTCHVQKKFRFNIRKKLDATDLLAHHHEEIAAPDIFNFVSPQSEQKPVVFQHKEHVELYRYKCEHCHTQTDCSTCHNYTPSPAGDVKTLAVHHNPCSRCHDTEVETGCELCHRSTPSGGFTHGNTGWELNKHHQPLSCNQCHVGEEPIAALDNTCTNCHDNFEVGSFEHAVTGLQLNEDHEEIDCYECHTDDQYDITPTCVECHDEDLSFPTDIPGELIKLK